MLKPYTGAFRLPQAHRLLRRLAFGGSLSQLDQLAQWSGKQALEHLLQPRKAITTPFHPEDGINNGAQVRLTQISWLYQMLHSPVATPERLMFFWHGHFAIGVDKVRTAAPLLHYLGVLRQNYLGSFKNFAQAIAKTPAMLRYLDNDENTKTQPNENFARELFELFTTGIGPYQEKDIQEAARAFTGWRYKGKTSQDLHFQFAANKHDSGPKTVLGRSGKLTGEDVVSIAAQHPQTSQFLARKLWKAFISDQASPSDIQALADVWRGSQGNLAEVYRVLFTSQAFYDAQNVLIKSPLDFMIGSARALEFPVQEEKFYLGMLNILSQLSHEPLHPPDVSGWEGGRSWISDGAILRRMQYASSLTLGKSAHLPKHQAWSTLLLGQETSPLNPLLSGLVPERQAYTVLIAPEYYLM